jgi:hypothetical protein
MAVTIDPNTLSQLQSILAQYQALNVKFAAILTSQSGGVGGSATVSPSGTKVVGPSTDTLTDATLAVWSLGGGAPYGYVIMKNGSPFANGSGVSLIIDKVGVIWTLNNTNQWYTATASGWAQSASGPSI